MLKEGSACDLPIIVEVLIATSQLKPESEENSLVIGVLFLDSSVRYVKGLLLTAALEQQDGYKLLIFQGVDASEAALIPDITVIPPSILNACYDHLAGLQPEVTCLYCEQETSKLNVLCHPSNYFD